jgi:hypothetical protein
MKISGESFLGFVIPSIPSGTTSFNSSSYGEVDLITSMLRGIWLTINTGRNSDENKFFKIKIQGIGEVDGEAGIGYYRDSLFVWGIWKKVGEDETNDFLGVVSGYKSGSSTFYLDLHPKKISAE